MFRLYRGNHVSLNAYYFNNMLRWKTKVHRKLIRNVAMHTRKWCGDCGIRKRNKGVLLLRMTLYINLIVEMLSVLLSSKTLLSFLKLRARTHRDTKNDDTVSTLSAPEQVYYNNTTFIVY